MRFMTLLSSSGHHGDTGADAVQVAGLASAARADALHELDEVAGDEAAGRHRVGAGIAEAVAAAGPARDVDSAEVLDGHGPLLLPWKVPNGVRNTETIRRSACERFGKRLQWLGDVHVVGLSVPRMRWFMPAATWLTAWPVRMPTHVHGCGRPSSCWGRSARCSARRSAGS